MSTQTGVWFKLPFFMIWREIHNALTFVILLSGSESSVIVGATAIQISANVHLSLLFKFLFTAIWEKRNELGNVGRVVLPFLGERNLRLDAQVPRVANLYFTSSLNCRGHGRNSIVPLRNAPAGK